MRWEDFHRHTDRIVDHYAPLIEEAMAHVLDPDVVRRAIAEAYSIPAADVAKAASWRDLLKLAQRATQKLKDLLARIYGDGYLQGSKEAADASKGQMPPWTATVNVPEGHWDTWTPGVGDAAAKVAGGGLAQLLRNRDIWIKQMTDTQVGRIGDAIADGIRQGFPVKEVTEKVDQIVNDAQRAYLIAETEYARAMTVAARETYRLNNVPMVQWMSQPGACPRCEQNQAVSPISIDAQWPNGDVPVHPHCRCAEAPYVRVPGRNTP